MTSSPRLIFKGRLCWASLFCLFAHPIQLPLSIYKSVPPRANKQKNRRFSLRVRLPQVWIALLFFKALLYLIIRIMNLWITIAISIVASALQDRSTDFFVDWDTCFSVKSQGFPPSFWRISQLPEFAFFCWFQSGKIKGFYTEVLVSENRHCWFVM